MNICTCVLYHEVLVCMAFVKHVNRHNTRRVYEAHECGCTCIRIHTRPIFTSVNRDPLEFSHFCFPFLLKLPWIFFVSWRQWTFLVRTCGYRANCKFLFAAIYIENVRANRATLIGWLFPNALPRQACILHNPAISDRRFSYGMSRSRETRSFITHLSLDTTVRSPVSHLYQTRISVLGK